MLPEKTIKELQKIFEDDFEKKLSDWSIKETSEKLLVYFELLNKIKNKKNEVN